LQAYFSRCFPANCRTTWRPRFARRKASAARADECAT
jgi:hypothetical protein